MSAVAIGFYLNVNTETTKSAVEPAMAGILTKCRTV